MQEWSFEDCATAEAFYRAQQHQLKSRRDCRRRRLLQVGFSRLLRLERRPLDSAASPQI